MWRARCQIGGADGGMSGHLHAGSMGGRVAWGRQAQRVRHASEGAGKRCRLPRPSPPPTWSRCTTVLSVGVAEVRSGFFVCPTIPRPGSSRRSIEANPSIDHALRLRQDGGGCPGTPTRCVGYAWSRRQVNVSHCDVLAAVTVHRGPAITQVPNPATARSRCQCPTLRRQPCPRRAEWH